MKFIGFLSWIINEITMAYVFGLQNVFGMDENWDVLEKWNLNEIESGLNTCLTGNQTESLKEIEIYLFLK